ncbi:DUF2878 domain-containing protein [Cellvibrio sp. OA-2007]|uniref:DUF2878 domain-containing protein n=1 Tax=Cellvibrio sp. OA-2007 TaxID=529823 RepID=UPI0007815247|nr:DUF2878 domain-containing protein [Cellvibrio sp. OA-2007]
MKRRALLLTIANVLVFQAGWLVCILFGSLWAGAFTLCALVLHFVFYTQRLKDTVAVLLAVVIGLVHDLLLLHTGSILFLESVYLPPLWLMCLWVLLGLTLNHSLSWIYSRPLWSGLLGAIAAPMSYMAGVKLSSAEWSSPILEVVPIIAALWLVILPLHRLISLRVLTYVQHKTAKLPAPYSDC